MANAYFFRAFFISMMLLIEASASVSVGFFVCPGAGFATFAILALILLVVVAASFIATQKDQE